MKLSLKTKINAMFFAIILMGTIVMAIIMSNTMKGKVIESAQEKLKSDLAMTKELLNEKYPGEWSIINNEMYKGQMKINDNFTVIDMIGELTNDTVTVFQDNIRISTNVKNEDGTRAVGTKVSEEVELEVLENKKTYIGKAKVANVWNQTIYDPIKDSNGNIIGILYVGVPNTPYDNMALEFQYRTYIFGIILIIVGSIAAWIFSSNLIKNLRNINNVAENIAQGDLTVTSNVSSKDEIETLSDSLNNMRQNLQSLIMGISSIARDLSTSSEELSYSSDESSQASEQMAKTMDIITQENERQSISINEVLVETQQIASSTQELVAIANNMASMTNKTTIATKEGTEAVGKAVEQMENINTSTESVNQAIDMLTSSSKQINDILNVITNIAEQTNLLALNAAIEAAGAGEAGRGFAVVAEEVRKLAEQSRVATKRITLLVNENDENIENAHKAMKQEAEDVKIGMEVANTARISFAQVDKLTNELSLHINEIISAIEQIAEGNQNTVTSVENIADISKATVTQTETAAAVTEEQVASVEETTSLSHALASMANDLEEHIRLFRI